jgi:DnaJ-domain-containing protein 1
MNYSLRGVVSRLARQTGSRHSLSFSAAPPSHTQWQLQLQSIPVCGTRTSLSWRSKSCQCHYFSSSTGGSGNGGSDNSNSTTPNLMSGNPFVVLGVEINSTFSVVRLAFVKLALEHHPDRDSGSTENFLKIRAAFEEIQQDQNGGNTDGSGRADRKGGGSGSSGGVPFGWTEDELREWYQEETGDFATFTITESTRQEVIEVYKTMLQSGKAPKGGYWDYARQLTEREALRGKSDDGDGPMKLLGDDSKSPSIGRRKRHRK